MTRYVVTVARILLALVFLLNGFGIIDQSVAARELIERGAPAAIVPALMWMGRAMEVVAGVALVLNFHPGLAALGLLAFLVPATFVSHAFWRAAGTPEFQKQLVNFGKNAAIGGGLLYMAAENWARLRNSSKGGQ